MEKNLLSYERDAYKWHVLKPGTPEHRQTTLV